MTVYRYDDPRPGAWAEFIQEMHSGRVFEVDEEMYYHWLEILPPVWMNRPLEVEGQGTVRTFGFAEGQDLVTAFWRKGGRFFGVRTEIVNPVEV